jgi:hypothetical protein
MMIPNWTPPHPLHSYDLLDTLRPPTCIVGGVYHSLDAEEVRIYNNAIYGYSTYECVSIDEYQSYET